jgi:hypothetical protein
MALNSVSQLAVQGLILMSQEFGLLSVNFLLRRSVAGMFSIDWGSHLQELAQAPRDHVPIHRPELSPVTLYSVRASPRSHCEPSEAGHMATPISWLHRICSTTRREAQEKHPASIHDI